MIGTETSYTLTQEQDKFGLFNGWTVRRAKEVVGYVEAPTLGGGRYAATAIRPDGRFGHREEFLGRFPSLRSAADACVA